MTSHKRLTVSRIKALPTPITGQVEHFDAAEPGFAVRVTGKGVRSFVAFYRVDGKLRRDTIGRFNEAATDGEPGSLGWARGLARERRALAANGIDPRALAEAERKRRQRSVARTYAAMVEKFIETHAKAKRGNKTWREQRRILLATAPEWRARPVAEIDREAIQGVLDALMKAGKPYMANRTYAALRTFFGWCVRRDCIAHHPMEKIDRPFDGEKPRERHFGDDEIKALWNACDNLNKPRGGADAPGAKAADRTALYRGAFVKVLVLTGVRRGELAGMRWSEIADDGLWTVPPERFKPSRPARPRSHTVPLPKLALRIIEALPRIEGTDLVFPGRRTQKPMAGWSQFKRKVAEASGIGDFAFHPIRHTVRTGLSALGYPSHVKNAVLGHIEPGTGAKYDHHQYLDERRDALEAWARHVAKTVWGENVEAIHG